MTTDVLTAVRCFIREIQWFGWQVLLIGSGLWLEAALCIEHFVVDLAEVLQQKALRSQTVIAGHWGQRVLGAVWKVFTEAARWCRPGAQTWRQLALRTDAALLKRRGLTDSQGGQARLS